jgi:uncharacterized repeat protein (TIGR03803 family)
MGMTGMDTTIRFLLGWLPHRERRGNAGAQSTPDIEARPNFLLLGTMALAALCGYGGTAQAAPQLKVLLSFTNLKGAYPQAGLIADGAGNLYGTTTQGGANSDGVVFELSPPVAGKTAWTETVLRSFDETNGYGPYAGLLADGAGNLYGTTTQGGANNDGAVFELSPPAAGKKAWTETVLQSFDETNGQYPASGLLADVAGNLYGTTDVGGANNFGEVFELSPPAAGKKAWTETVLQSFNGTNGQFPQAGLLADGAGNLYGTTQQGGANSDGVVFELSPPAAGKRAWTETLLQSFDETNGQYPASGLLADGAGNLYGTTVVGGANNDGVVFELSPPAAGKKAWTETLLQSFDGTNGQFPQAGLLADVAGNLYGTTQQGGSHSVGVVFELSPPAAGKRAWTETLLQSFDGTNGQFPQARLIADVAGNLYGTTQQGGSHSVGVVFKLTP